MAREHPNVWEVPIIKRSEAEAAIISVLGLAVYDACSCDLGLPELLKMAALKAFREDWPGNNMQLDRIRGSLLMLSRNGEFSFIKE